MPHALGIGRVVTGVVGGLDVACVVAELAAAVLVCGHRGRVGLLRLAARGPWRAGPRRPLGPPPPGLPTSQPGPGLLFLPGRLPVFPCATPPRVSSPASPALAGGRCESPVNPRSVNAHLLFPSTHSTLPERPPGARCGRPPLRKAWGQAGSPVKKKRHASFSFLF